MIEAANAADSAYARNNNAMRDTISVLQRIKKNVERL